MKAAAPGSTPAQPLLGFIVEQFLRHLERGGVAMLFVLHHAGDALDALHHLGISVAHQFGDEAGELIEIRLRAPIMRALRMARRMILRST